MKYFSKATLPQVREMLTWAEEEGWNPGIEDAEAFYAADPGGFFIASVDSKPIASISVVNHSPTFAFLGLYIVRPEFRGRGIGLELWAHAMMHAGSRTVGLDGVLEQQENYAKSGFWHAGSTTRYRGVIPSNEGPPRSRLANAGDIDMTIDWEARASGFKKVTYLRDWCRETNTRKTLVLPGGVCTVRLCVDGAKVGPLLAEEPSTALELLRDAAGVFGGDIMIDVPDTSKALRKTCLELGMLPCFETARMYIGNAKPNSNELFAVSSLELG